MQSDRPGSAEQMCVETVYPYQGADRHQLTLFVKDRITVLERDASGWWIGRNQKGQVGIFPSTYVRPCVPHPAPSEEITREVRERNVYADIGIALPDLSAVRPEDLENELDDLFGLEDYEIEQEIRTADKAVETLSAKQSSAMQSILAVQADDERSSEGLSTLKQQTTIARKRLVELERKEKEVADELTDYKMLASESGINVEALLLDTMEPQSPMAQSPQLAPAAAPAQWLAGIEDNMLVEYCKQLEEELNVKNDALDVMEQELEVTVKEVKDMEQHIVEKEGRVQKFVNKAEAVDQEISELEAELQSYVQDAAGVKVAQKAALREKEDSLASVSDKLNEGKKQNRRLQDELEAVEASSHRLQTEYDRLLGQQQALVDEESRVHALLAVAETPNAAEAEALKQEHSTLAAVYSKAETRRRRLYNEIQDLRGNIRVYCRVRYVPGASEEDLKQVRVHDSMTLEVVHEDTMKTVVSEFDHVIGPNATQQEVFEEVKPLATSILDGYHVCIFAYGQTGSGKTFTMEGPPNNRGINFRTVDELFSTVHQRKDEYAYSMKLAVLEVYNDNVFDLQAGRTQCSVRSAGNNVKVDPLTKVEVHSTDEIVRLLESSYENRRVGSTSMNEHSSRSHCVVTLFLEGTNLATQQTTSGKLHLIDLAGSERLKKSEAEGSKRLEAQHINKSLSHLRLVINGLVNKNGHIPYRNSKLTHLLQDSLGGNCKCMMFANISPLASNTAETISTMMYAADVRKVELGKATANVQK